MVEGKETTEVEESRCDKALRPYEINYCRLPCPGHCVVSNWSAWSNCSQVNTHCAHCTGLQSISSGLVILESGLGLSIFAGLGLGHPKIKSSFKFAHCVQPFRCLARRIFPAKEVNNNPQSAG